MLVGVRIVRLMRPKFGRVIWWNIAYFNVNLHHNVDDHDESDDDDDDDDQNNMYHIP